MRLVWSGLEDRRGFSHDCCGCGRAFLHCSVSCVGVLVRARGFRRPFGANTSKGGAFESPGTPKPPSPLVMGPGGLILSSGPAGLSGGHTGPVRTSGVAPAYRTSRGANGRHGAPWGPCQYHLGACLPVVRAQADPDLCSPGFLDDGPRHIGATIFVCRGVHDIDP